MEKIKLPPEFKVKWVEALRSGKYSQVEGYLRLSDGFCCLGVACDLHKPDTWRPMRAAAKDGVYLTATNGDILPNTDDLPAEVLSALRQQTSETSYNLVQDVLTGMNDNGHSFKTIANWIEENL